MLILHCLGVTAGEPFTSLSAVMTNPIICGPRSCLKLQDAREVTVAHNTSIHCHTHMPASHWHLKPRGETPVKWGDVQL